MPPTHKHSMANLAQTATATGTRVARSLPSALVPMSEYILCTAALHVPGASGSSYLSAAAVPGEFPAGREFRSLQNSGASAGIASPRTEGILRRGQ